MKWYDFPFYIGGKLCNKGGTAYDTSLVVRDGDKGLFILKKGRIL